MFQPNGVVMEDVSGATAFELTPTGGGDIVEQLNAAAARIAWGWWVTGASILAGLLTLPWGLIVWAALAPVCAWTVLNDRARKTVVLFYDVADEPFAWFDTLVRTWPWLSQSQRLWRILQSGNVATTYQFKTNSGASRLLNRVAASADTSGPAVLSTNIAVPSITAGKAAIFFLPDRILVRDGKHFSDIAYSHLNVYAGATRFIEDGATPGDAVQVDYTWRFVNVKGGPDRRYNNNRVLPIMQYGTIDITSGQGLQWRLQVSRAEAAAPVTHAIVTAPAPTRPAGPPRTAPAPALPRVQQPKTQPPPPAPAPPAPPPPKPAPLLTTPTPQSTRPKAKTGFFRVDLTRNPTSYPTTGATFTAIDLETTGLDPMTDRIVEIGLVKFSADGTILDEFATLVNSPGSDAQARAVHQIDDADLAGAPSIDQALGEVLAFVAGTVLVAHNCEFEESLLSAAAKRAGIKLPRIAALCTLQTSRRQLQGRAFSLTVMYKTATDGWSDQRHTALGDARAVREVLLWLLHHAPQPLYLTDAVPPTSAAIFTETPISCRPVPLTRGSVAELLDSFPQSPKLRTGDPEQARKYIALLEDAVDDGRLTYEEADALTRLARATRLTGPQLRALHQTAWEQTYPDSAPEAWPTYSPVQRREMYLLADALGLTELAHRINAVIEDCAEPAPPPEARYLRGLRIAIVGDHSEMNELRARAESHGAKLAVNITKTVQWMVSITPDATDSRHTTAHKLGIPIIGPAEGTARLDEAIREAELKAYERQREIDRHAALRQQRADEADAYWRPTWRSKELDYDPEFEPWSE
ncbi:exonuclease domain-containing protein [Mycolicibacterium cosmeticum]